MSIFYLSIGSKIISTDRENKLCNAVSVIYRLTDDFDGDLEIISNVFEIPYIRMSDDTLLLYIGKRKVIVYAKDYK